MTITDSTSPNPPVKRPYTTNLVYQNTTLPGYSGVAGVSPAADAQGHATTATATVSGQTSPLTVTFAWKPAQGQTLLTDPPPTAAIVYQDCSASCHTNINYGPVTGSCADGLGGSASIVPPATGTSTHSVKYVAGTVAGDGGVSVPGISPNVVYTVGSGTGVGSRSNGNALVIYNPTATPVYLNLTGTTLDASKQDNILVGQGCGASISGLPAFATATGNKTVYTWSVDGTKFQSWNGDSGTVPVSAVMGLGATNQSTAHWFWADTAGPKAVTCTVTVTPPAGQGNAFTVMVKKSVNLEVPNWTANNTVGAGYIGIDNGVTSIFAGPTATTISNGYQNGSNWHTLVPIPPDFTGTGQWQYAQIVSSGEYETPVGGTQKQSTQTGLTGLDDVFPHGVVHDTGGSFVTDVDSPNFPVLDTYSAVGLKDAFATYLMFQPPLAPSAPTSGPQWVQWVCLAESSWNTGLSASRPGSGLWKDFPATQTIGVVGLIHDFQPFTTHPHWDVRISNTTVFP